MSYLFGLIDSKTYKETQEVIQGLSNPPDEDINTINMHIHILNVTLLHMKDIKTNQNRAIEAINHISTNLAILNHTLQSGLEEIYDVNNNLNLISAISYDSSAISDLDYKF